MTIAENLQAILTRIDTARKAAVKPAPTTRLVAISKTHDAAAVAQAIAAGQRVFGENRVQEAQAKFPDLRAAHPDLELHLVGPLQSNKTREAMALFDAIHSLDRPRLADALKAETERGASCPKLFIQVNTGEEPQKAGVMPREAGGFIAYARDALGLPVIGLMCIPPLDDDAAPHFALLKKIADENNLSSLSMGMSGDFEMAIRFGASHVRIGSAIFGARG